MKAIIDGDALVMMAGFSSEKREHGEVVWVDEKPYALHKAKLGMQSVLNYLETDSYELYLSDDAKHFRYSVAKTQKYKGNRDPNLRPTHEQNIKVYYKEHWGAKTIKNVEVDDAIGIKLYKDYINNNKDKKKCGLIACHADKDIRQIPGWHLDLDYGKMYHFNGKRYKKKSYMEDRMYWVDEEGELKLLETDSGKKKLFGTGKLFFATQLLTGDSVDNIPGLPKQKSGKTGKVTNYGELGAYKLLKDLNYKQAIQTVWSLYKKNLKNFEDYEDSEIKDRFLEIAQLLWIKRVEGKEDIFPLGWLE